MNLEIINLEIWLVNNKFNVMVFVISVIFSMVLIVVLKFNKIKFFVVLYVKLLGINGMIFVIIKMMVGFFCLWVI